MNSYELKQKLRKQRYADKAKKLKKEAESLYQRYRANADCIPFGQPILINHHSEKRDRRFRQRLNKLLEKSANTAEKAAYYEEKASITSDAISSDDPDAIVKLEAKLEGLIASQNRMKEINRLFKRDRNQCFEQLSDAEREAVMNNLRFQPSGKAFPNYALSNNSQNITRIKSRIAILKQAREASVRPDIQGSGYLVKEDKNDNRLLFIFDEKPNEAIRRLLKQKGFKWSPTRAAWVRMLNNAGRYAVERVISQLSDLMK